MNKVYCEVASFSSYPLRNKTATLVWLFLLALLTFAAVFPVPAVVYVDKNATGANNGNSWADAYTTIQTAIDDADVADEEVWVAAAGYDEAIVMKSGVAVYGGFNGTETSRSERNWTTNLTTIDASTALGGSAAYHVVTIDSVTSCSIDGFTITGGYADGPLPDYNGGGIYCFNLDGSNTIANNTITTNSAEYYGGGIYCDNASPLITSNTITGNYATTNGGGVSCSEASPTVMNNTIAGNSAFYYCGGIDCYSSWATIMNNTISGNTGGDGGGLLIYYYCAPTIMNNQIVGNSTTANGGGIHCTVYVTATITNNLIAQNSAVSDGGGIYCTYYSEAIITSNTILGNSSALNSGGGIYCDGSSCIIRNNTVSGNSADDGGGGIYCLGQRPEVKHNTISGNSALDGGGIYCFGTLADIINNAVAGNVAENGGAIYCDSSLSTIANNTISANSAASYGGGILCDNSALPLIKNTIFSNNNKYDIYEYTWDSDPDVLYNDFYGNTDGVYYDEGTTPYTSVSVMDATIPECSNNIGLDPLFVGDTVSVGTWTADAVYNSSTFQTTLTNSSASWTVNEHAGRLLNPDTSQNKQFVIVSNTPTTINVWGNVSSMAQSGNTYKIFDYHLQNLYDGYPVASPCIDAGDPLDDYSNEPMPNGGRINQGRYGNTPEAARTGTTGVLDWYMY